MSLRKKLQRWQDQGLIEQDVMQGILAYEKQRGSGRFSKALYGLGGFAIVIGVLAIIAANWQIIPPNTKLFVHLAINTALAFSVFKFNAGGQKVATNISVLLLMGLTLTLIALTGQVFHLDGSIESALITWMALTTPFVVAFANSKIALLPWMIGLLTTIILGAGEYVMPHFDRDIVPVVGLYTLLTLGFIHLSALKITAKNKTLQSVLYYSGAASVIIGASLACMLWYDFTYKAMQDYTLVILGIFAIGAAWAKFLPLPENIVSNEDEPYIRKLIFLSLGFAFMPFIIPAIGGSVTAAFSFIIFWLIVGYLAQKTDRTALMNIAITLIAIRIYIIYIELFGSLLQTGFGLILSGGVLIGLAWGARKINKTLSSLSMKGEDHV